MEKLFYELLLLVFLCFSEIALESDEERVRPVEMDGQLSSHFISGLLVLGASKAQNFRKSFFPFVPQSILL